MPKGVQSVTIVHVLPFQSKNRMEMTSLAGSVSVGHRNYRAQPMTWLQSKETSNSVRMQKVRHVMHECSSIKVYSTTDVVVIPAWTSEQQHP